jgi:hypothetical protein
MSIGQDGCFLVCLAMLSNQTPDIVNKLFTEKGAYSTKPGEEGEIIDTIAFSLVGLKYLGETNIKPHTLCIVKTNFYAPKYPTHFFILKPNGHIVDPLKGKELFVNKYQNNMVLYKLLEYV